MIQLFPKMKVVKQEWGQSYAFGPQGTIGAARDAMRSSGMWCKSVDAIFGNAFVVILTPSDTAAFPTHGATAAFPAHSATAALPTHGATAASGSSDRYKAIDQQLGYLRWRDR